MSSIETVTINELVIKIHRMTRTSLCIHQGDAMGYYDCIIHNHVIISSQKFGILDNVYNLHSLAHDKKIQDTNKKLFLKVQKT